MTETQASETEVSSHPDAREKADILEEFVEEWVCTLDRDDKKALAMLLYLTLVNELSFTETRAAELTAKIVHKSDRTVRQWRTDLIANNGVYSESKQGRYQCTGVLWASAELSKTAGEYVRANSAVKGRPNMTTMDF